MIQILVLSVIGMLIGCAIVGHRARLSRAKNPFIIKPRPEEEIKSRAGKLVLNRFNSLPDSHRPAIDIVSTLKALEVKYEHYDITQHFVDAAEGYMWEDDSLYFSWECLCVSHYGKSECVIYPEFIQLHKSISEVEGALQDLNNKIQAREREMVLAGIEGELRNVDFIVATLRSERELINEVVKEI